MGGGLSPFSISPLPRSLHCSNSKQLLVLILRLFASREEEMPEPRSAPRLALPAEPRARGSRGRETKQSPVIELGLTPGPSGPSQPQIRGNRARRYP